MRTGSNIPVDSKTTDSIAKIAKSEYTDKINQKYGGRRARRAYSNAPSLADVQRQVDLKDRLKQKYGKGEYRKGFTKTQGVNQADVSKKIASDTKAYNQKRTSNFKKFSTDAKEINRRLSASLTRGDQARSQYQSSGGFGDSNTGMGANTQNRPVTQTPTPSKNIKIDSKYTPPKTSAPVIKVDTPKPPKPDKVTQGNKIVDKGFKTPPLSKTAKTFKDFASKLPKPVRTAGRITKNVGGKLIAPAFAAWDAADAYKGYRSKGHGKTGSAVRGAVKAGSTWAGLSKGAALGAKVGMFLGPKGALAGGLIGGALGAATASKLSDTAVNAYDKVFKPKAKLDKKYQDPKYVAGVVKQKKAKKPVTGLSLGVSDKQWKARFGEEYVQERFRSQAIQTYLKNKAGQQDLINKANKFKQENPGTDFSKGAAMSNPNLTPSSSFNNNSTEKPVPTQTTQKPVVKTNTNTQSSGSSTSSSGNNQTVTKPFDKSKDIGGTSAIADKDKITPVSSTSRPGGGSITLPKGGFSKFAPKNNQQPSGGGSTPQARPVPQAGSTPQAKPVAQAQARPVPQAGSTPQAKPVAQAQPQRTVGGQGNRQRPVKTGGIQLGNAIRKPIGSAINAVRSALSNKGPIQGRQTGAQRRAAQTANRPVTQAPVAKPVQAAPVAKPVTQAPVAKPVLSNNSPAAKAGIPLAQRQQAAQKNANFQANRPDPMARRNARLAAMKNKGRPLAR